MASQHMNTRCRFLDLPTELRLHIYRYLFPDCDIVEATEKPSRSDGGPISSTILRANRQIYNEAVAELYKREFEVQFTPWYRVRSDLWTRSYSHQAPDDGPTSPTLPLHAYLANVDYINDAGIWNGSLPVNHMRSLHISVRLVEFREPEVWPKLRDALIELTRQIVSSEKLQKITICVHGDLPFRYIDRNDRICLLLAPLTHFHVAMPFSVNYEVSEAEVDDRESTDRRSCDSDCKLGRAKSKIQGHPYLDRIISAIQDPSKTMEALILPIRLFISLEVAEQLELYPSYHPRHPRRSPRAIPRDSTTM